MRKAATAVFVLAMVLVAAPEAQANCRADIMTVENILRVGEPGRGGGPLDRINLNDARKLLALAKQALAEGQEADCELHMTAAKKRVGVTF